MVRQRAMRGRLLGLILGIGTGLGCAAPDPSPMAVPTMVPPPTSTTPPATVVPDPVSTMPTVSTVSTLSTMTTRAYLADPRTFRVDLHSSASVTAKRGSDGETDSVAMPMSAGTVTIQARDDGTLAVTALDLDLGHVTLSAATIPPDGLDLEHVKLSLAGEADIGADWSGDRALNGAATTELLLDWSVATAGVTLPLATEHIASVAVELVVWRTDDGGIALDLHASREGRFWSWAGLLDLSDLHLDLSAAP